MAKEAAGENMHSDIESNTEAAPLRVAIVGAGSISKAHYKGYRSAGAEVVAISDVNAQALAKRQKQWNIPQTYRDYQEMLADPTIDAVSVCTPNALHHPVTIAAAQAGKHVLCEKPISLALDKAQAMVDACREAGVLLQIGHHLRAEGVAQQAKKMLETGVIGQLTYIRLRQAHDWAGLPVRSSFATFASSGGGTLLDNGCHLMDLARFFAGEVQEVYARTATLKYSVEVEDTSFVSMEFASGALGVVENSWSATGWEWGFWLYGTEGALEFSNRYGNTALHHSFRNSPGTTWGDTDVARYSFTGYESHVRSVMTFCEAIRGQGSLLCSGEDGLEAVRLVLAGYESAKQRRPVVLSDLADDLSLRQITQVTATSADTVSQIPSPSSSQVS